jgi:hypothetical protein
MASTSFTKYQRNYSAPKRELLAIMFALRRFHDHLFGAKFMLWTDHRALTFLLTQDNPSYMLKDWLGTLLEYRCTICHTPGAENIVPDGLSRLYEVFSKPKSREEMPHTRASKIMTKEMLKYPEKELQLFIHERLNKTLPSAEKRAQLISEAHCDAHFGSEYIFKQLFQDRDMYWPGMKQDIIEACSSCVPCLQYNIGKAGYHLARPQNKSEVFDCVAVDLGDFPTSVNGYNYFMVMVDLCSGFTILRPLKEKTDVAVAAIYYEVFSLFGWPAELQSDCGSEFLNNLIRSINEIAKVRGKHTSPYNPRCNGAAENRVKQVKMGVRKQVNGNFTHWETMLPRIQLGINVKELPRTGTCPFTLVFNRSSPLPCSSSTVPSTPMSITEIQERSEAIRELVYPIILERSLKSKQRMASRFNDKHKRPAAKLVKGAGVMIRDGTRASKNDPKYLGPYIIFEVTDALTYRLANLDGTSVGRPLAADKLKLVKSNFWRELEDAYEVAGIKDHREETDGSFSFLTRWKGYDERSDTWEPEGNFFADKLIKAYWEAVRTVTGTAKVRAKFKNKKLSRVQQDAILTVQLKQAAQDEDLDAEVPKAKRQRRQPPADPTTISTSTSLQSTEPISQQLSSTPTEQQHQHKHKSTTHKKRKKRKRN